MYFIKSLAQEVMLTPPQILTTILSFTALEQHVSMTDIYKGQQTYNAVSELASWSFLKGVCVGHEACPE